MKILILSDNFPPYAPGGAERSTFELARAFQKKEHEVFVITTCREKKLCGEENLAGLKIFRIFSNYHPRWRAYLSLYNPRTVRKVGRFLQEIRPDIVHVNNIHYHLSYFCLKLAKKYSKRVFLTARDTMLFTYGKLATKRYLEHGNCHTSWWAHLKQARTRYNPLRNFFIKRYLAYVDKIFSVSSVLKDALNQNGIENVEVGYTGIDVDDWRVGLEKIEEFKRKYKLGGKKVIFFGGRINSLKGIKQVNQAMAKVKERIPEAVLLIAGSGGVGWLSGKELRAAYGAADIVVVPSVYLDPFPRSNLEAMARKKPVVTTCYGGSPEIVLDNVTGYVVNPLNVNLMAEKIIDLLKNPQKASQFGEAGYQRVKEEFNLEKQADKYLERFEEFLFPRREKK